MVQTESLTSLKLQVDHDIQVHSFTDSRATWKFINPISVTEVIKKYNNLLEETDKGLRSLKIQVNHDGQVHSFTDANKTWIFKNPISLVDLVEMYNGVLANVDKELKVKKEPLPKSFRGRFFNRR
jgi:DNA-binding MltR family transcriptional regulator